MYNLWDSSGDSFMDISWDFLKHLLGSSQRFSAFFYDSFLWFQKFPVLRPENSTEFFIYFFKNYFMVYFRHFFKKISLKFSAGNLHVSCKGNPVVPSEIFANSFRFFFPKSFQYFPVMICFCAFIQSFLFKRIPLDFISCGIWSSPELLYFLICVINLFHLSILTLHRLWSSCVDYS